MISPTLIMPSVGQRFKDVFYVRDTYAFLNKTQQEATGMVPRPYIPSFKVEKNGLDNLGAPETGLTTRPIPASPAPISTKPANDAAKPDTWKEPNPATSSDDLLQAFAETSDSVQADLTQIATHSTVTISRRNLIILIVLAILIFGFLIAILKK